MTDAIGIVEKKGIKCQVGYNRRFDPDFAALKNSAEKGAIGTIHIVKITNRYPKRADLNYIPKSGGLFLDFNVHNFDMARYLTGSEVRAVMAIGSFAI